MDIITRGRVKYLSTYGLTGALRIWNESRIISGSIISIFIFLAIVKFFTWQSNRYETRRWLFAGFLGFVFSLILVYGKDIYEYDSILSNISCLKNAVFLTPLFGGAVSALMEYYDQGFALIANSSIEKRVQRICQNEKRFLIGCFGLMIICWVVCLLATWLGIYGYDVVYQLKQYDERMVSGHHPILHTYLIGWLIDAGRLLSGNEELGLLFYSIIQMVFMAGVLTYLIMRLKSMLPTTFRVVITLLFTFLPFNILLSFSTTKDVIFSCLVVLVGIKSYDLVKQPEQFFKAPMRIIFYVILVFFMCAFRNNGIYAYLVMGFFFVSYDARFSSKGDDSNSSNYGYVVFVYRTWI